MARRHELVYGLNAGGVDPEAIARVDLEKMRLAGEHPVSNLMPRVLGPAMIRPPLESLARITSDAVTRIIEFTKSSTITNLLLLSGSVLRIYDADGVPVPVVNSSSAISDATFAGPASGTYSGGWKNDSEAGPSVTPTVTFGSGLTMTATTYYSASVQQAITIAGGDQAKAHTVTFDVTRGPFLVRMGTAADTEDLLTETELLTGVHKITVTPNAGTLYIKIRSTDTVERKMASVTFEHTVLGGAGTLTLATPWVESVLRNLVSDQSGDVLFIGDGAKQQRRIERRGATSWSLALYTTRNGPLLTPRSKVTLTPSVIEGNGTLTASLGIFKASHVGTLFEMTHGSQTVSKRLDGIDQVSDFVSLVGIGTTNERQMTYALTFSGGATLTCSQQRSLDPDQVSWGLLNNNTATVASTTFTDPLDNVTAHHRFKITAYTSGYVDVSVTYPGGSRTGLVRVTGYTSPTQVSIEVIKPLGGTTATREWRWTAWSDDLGWPGVPRFFDGRLWWFRGDKAYGSITDDFDNYDDSLEGDSAPIIRSIGSGPTEGARWALDMQRLIVGTSGFEASIRSSSFDEPLTPTQFTVKNASTLGVANVQAVKVDRGAIFVQRSGRRIYELLYSGETNDYTSQDVSRLNPAAFSSPVIDIAVQRQPDTRVYFVLENGSVVVLTYERDDKVVAFTTITTTNGTIEDVAVLPDTDQDDVYFIVKRNTTERYLERLGKEEAQRSVSTCALLDAHKVLTGSISSITGGTHLAGQTVQVWADGRRRSDVTLDGSGVAALGATYARVVYGKRYTAAYKSVKLAYAAQLGTAVGQTKQVRGVGLVLKNACLDGIQIGRDADHLEPMPAYVSGAARTTNQFFSHYDQDITPINSDWGPDARFYMTIDSAEGPCTVQALVLDVETRDGAGAQTGG